MEMTVRFSSAVLDPESDLDSDLASAVSRAGPASPAGSVFPASFVFPASSVSRASSVSHAEPASRVHVFRFSLIQIEDCAETMFRHSPQCIRFHKLFTFITQFCKIYLLHYK
jgi:hypothetical protein